MSNNLQAEFGHVFESGKTYTHAEGLSCCFRQWRASHSHCRFLHGYALQVTINFRALHLDDRNWVQDFGGLKPLKEWLKETFDHKTLIAQDDPQYAELMTLDMKGLIQATVVEHVGCEAFAKMIFEWVSKYVCDERVAVTEVMVREHEGNFARYRVDV